MTRVIRTKAPHMKKIKVQSSSQQIKCRRMESKKKNSLHKRIKLKNKLTKR